MVVSGEPWENITAALKGNKQLSGLEELVKFIAGSDYKYRFYGTIFLDNLILSGYVAFNLFAYCLHIGYENGQFTCGWYGPNGLAWEEKIDQQNMLRAFPELFGKIAWY